MKNLFLNRLLGALYAKAAPSSTSNSTSLVGHYFLHRLPLLTQQRTFLAFFVLALWLVGSGFSWGQCRLLDEKFDTNPTLAATNTDNAWYPDRYPPAGFSSALFNGRNVLKLSIDAAADGAANRPSGQQSSFYNTQGRLFNQCGNCGVTIAKGELYIPADWATKLRRTDLWSIAYDASNSVSTYGILGFRNVDGATPAINYWDGGAFVNSGVNITYDSWYSFEIRLVGTNVVYYVNGTQVGSVDSGGSVYFGNVIINAYNFNDATLPANSTDSYDAYWDNIQTLPTSGNKVTNISTGASYCTIQAAVDAATAGNSLSVNAGTYNELVTVPKSLTIQGAGATSIVSYTGAAIAITGNPGDVTPTLFKVTSPNVTIQNLTMNVDLSKIRSAVHTSGTTTNLAVIGNVITPSGTPGNNYGIRNAIAINPNLTNNGYTLDNVGFAGVVVKGNTVNVSAGGIGNSFRAAVQMDLSGGTIGGSTPADGNTFTAINHDVNVRFSNQGPVTIQNNTSLGGGIQFSEPNSGAGQITIANNTLTGATVQPSTGQLGTGALMRIQNNGSNIPVSVANNTFTNFRWGMSVENFQNITLNGNTFTPLANSTDYRIISFNTKLLASTSATITPVNIGATLTNNIFNGSGATGGTGIAFFNHRQDGGTPTIGTFILGQSGQENSFNAGIATFLRLDNSTGPSSGFVSPFGDYTISGAPSTTMNYWTPDLNAANNKFDVGTGLKLARNLSSTDRAALDGQLFDKNDDANVGRILYYFPVHNVTQNTDFPTIQAAVDAATAGDVLSAAAGLYVENVTVTKSLTILGANAGINPNTGTRGAETIVMSPTSGATDAAYPASLATIFSLTGNAANVVIDGFTLDGDNSNLTGQTNSVTINGVDIDAAIGISGYGASITGGAVRNNIIKNFSFDGVDYGSDGASTFSTIENNKFDNIAYVSVNTAAGVAIIVSDNGYANITSNTATRVRAGVQTNNFSQASTGGTPTISGNNFTGYRYGIFHNLHYGPATGFVISNNTITGDASLAGTTPLAGIALSSLQTAVPVTVSGNTVNAGFPYGIESWNTPTTGDVTLSGGSVQGSVAGVRVTNRNRFGDASASKLLVNGVTINNSPVGVLAFDDAASAAGIPASVTVTGNTQISGTGAFTAVAISGSDASASIVSNASSFTGNGSGVGVDVNGGGASINANRINSFSTGINVSNGGKLTGAANNFITGNATGVAYTADANATQGTLMNNDLSGNSSKAITNGLASTTIAATCNWYGTTNVDGQAGMLFSGAVTYSPYLNNGMDNEAGTPGFQPVPGSCVSNTPPVATANANQTATVGVAFSYTVNAFTDAETPSSLTYSASIVPTNGFTFNPATRVISGTPSMSGVSSVTVVATDPGSLSASTTFTITVSPASMTVTPTGPFAITAVNTIDCTPVANRINLTFNPQYTGVDGTPISFSVANELSPTTNPGPYTLSLYTDNPVITLKAVQSGVTSTFAYNWLAACNSMSMTPGNTAPTVANPIPPQSATVGQGFSYVIPANTFTDAETPNSLVLSVAGLPSGLSFTSPSTISGTPSMSGVSSVTVTATDPGNLSASTSFTLTVSPAASGTASSPFAITGVTTIDCTPVANRVSISFTPQYAGVDGTPITFSVVNELAPTTDPGPYSLTLYRDNPVITLKAVQSGVTSTFAYNWLAACNSMSMTPGNTAPTVANPIPPQSATVGQGFSYVIPANTFTDAETPNSLVLSVAGLPSGLSFTSPSTISGTPSMSGVSSVTVTATDPGNLSASTSFTLTVSPAASGTASSPFAITGVTTVSCATLSAGQRSVRFTPQYAGVDGTPITFSVVNELAPTTDPGPYTLSLYTDNPVITLKAVQSGVTSTFAYNWLAACNSMSMTPGNTAPTVANPIPPQSATVGQGFSYVIPANTFTDAETPNSLVLSVAGLPSGLSFTSPSTISGTPSMSGVSSVTVTATDPGNLSASTSFTLTVSPAASGTASSPFAITGVTTVSCATLSAGQRSVRFTPQYAGVDGTPITFSVVNELAPTTDPGPYTLSLYTDNPVITLKAVQSGVTSTFAYNWLVACNSLPAGSRQSAVESIEALSVRVLGNPISGETVGVEIRGVAGQSLVLKTLDSRGRLVSEQVVGEAQSVEQQTIQVGSTAGVYILQVSTPAKVVTTKILKR